MVMAGEESVQSCSSLPQVNKLAVARSVKPSLRSCLVGLRGW